MFNLFADFEVNLGRAGWLLVMEVAGGVALGLLLATQFGTDPTVVIPFVWLVNLPTAYFLSQAAKKQGKSAWLYGLSALGPPLALVAFSSLYSGHLLDRHRSGRKSANEA